MVYACALLARNFRVDIMTALSIGASVLAGLLLVLAGLPILYLFVLTWAALWPRRPWPEPATAQRIAILIPAHDESLLIAATVASARSQRYPAAAYTVWVIADNCTDNTAELARAAGAQVLERSGNPGKGQALHAMLEQLLTQDWAAFLIVDADSHLHPDTLAELNRALSAGAAALQIRYGVLNPDDGLRTQAMELSTASFNALRPRGRNRLGWSGGIYGNGFCLSRAVVQRVPYLAHSIVEDIEYHMHLLRAGYQVTFLDQVWVKAQMPIGGRGSAVQRARWERGRLLTIQHYVPELWRRWWQGDRRALDGLTDVLMPPVSLLVLGLLPALLVGPAAQRYLALAALLMLYGHYAVAAWRYGRLTTLGRLTLYVPWYFAWKTYIVLHSLWTQRQLPWLRTDRHAPPSQSKPE